MGSILALKETYSNCCFEFIVALTYRVRYVEHFDVGSSVASGRFIQAIPGCYRVQSQMCLSNAAKTIAAPPAVEYHFPDKFEVFLKQSDGKFSRFDLYYLKEIIVN